MSTKLKLWIILLEALALGFLGILNDIPVTYCLGFFTIATFAVASVLETN